MRDFISATLSAGREIASILKSGDSALYAKLSRGAGGDISIGADLKAEEILISALESFGCIDSEERGFIDNHKPHIIVIDPLDGSDNLLSHIPYYGASVALCDEDYRTKAAVIMNYCDNSAIVGFGDEILRGNLCGDLGDFKPLTMPQSAKCGIFERAYSNPKMCAILHKHSIKFRSLGALALSLGLANEVKFILFSGNKRKYDIQAGLFLARNLHQITHKNFILISRDKALFDKIAGILSEESDGIGNL